jgi:hypothetical protein
VSHLIGAHLRIDSAFIKADFFKELSDAASEKHLEHEALLPTWQSTMHLYPVNGKVNRVGESDTAVSYCDAVWSEVIVGVDRHPANSAKITNWAKEYYTALHPYGASGAHLNFMMEEGEDRIYATYRGNCDRLAAIKAMYDPGNFFRVNQDIRPGGIAALFSLGIGRNNFRSLAAGRYCCDIWP